MIKISNIKWNVFDCSTVTVNYKNVKKKRHNFNETSLGYGRYQHQFLVTVNNRNYAKQIRSMQANFIHSLDAYVNYYILLNYNYPIYPNHDSWGKAKKKNYNII